MKILHVIHSLAGGGAERQLSYLVAEFQSRQIETKILCIDSADPYEGITSAQIIKVERKQYWDISLVFSIVREIREYSPDLIHAWLPEVVTLPAMIAGALTRKPIVFSYRNEMKLRRLLSVAEFLCALVLCTTIISNTNISRCSFPYRFLYRWKRGCTISNGVHFPEKPRGKGPRQPGARVAFIFAGRICPQKNWALMLHALAMIDKKLWTLSVCGAGEELADLRSAVVQLDLLNNVRIVGFTKDLNLHLCRADYLLFPSLYEGMPNVLLEAMALGVPVIASDIAPNRQVAGPNSAIWFNPKSIDSLVNALNAAVSSEVDCAAMTSRARLDAARFSISTMASRYVEHYRSISRTESA